MWGDPHISVGRRVERPIQCRKVADTSQLVARCLGLGGDDCDLTPGIAGTVGEETIVVAPGAEGAHSDLLHPRLRGVLGDERSQIDFPWPRHRLAGQLLTHLDAHLVTPAADGWSEMNRKLVRRESLAGERSDRFCGDVSRGPAPAGVKERYNTRRVRDKDRDTVCYSDRERNSLLGCDVSIGLFSRAQPTLPATEMNQNARPVNLPEGDEPAGGLGQLTLHGSPPSHHVVDRLRAREAESPRVASGSERANPPTLEVGDYLLWDLTHAYWRRSSTRVIEAPRALRRSSIRS